MPTHVIERRFINQAESRAVPRDDGKGFKGYASVANQWAQIGDVRWGFKERFANGAWTKTLQEQDVVALADHDPAKPLSRMSAGTLSMAEDEIGLAVDSATPDTSYGNDLDVNLANGNVAGMSVGFRVIQDLWETDAEGFEFRTIVEAQLIEVSTTAFPAYTGTSAEPRSAEVRSVALARMSKRVRALKRDADTESDDDPNALAAGVDAAIDEAIDLFASVDTESLPPEVAQGIALIQAADATVDQLLAVLGVPDPDDGDRSRGPAETTRDGTDATGPADATQFSVTSRAMRMSALATIYGLPEPDFTKENSSV